jgi:hypothetical protein
MQFFNQQILYNYFFYNVLRIYQMTLYQQADEIQRSYDCSLIWYKFFPSAFVCLIFFVVLLILTLSLWHRCGKILFLLMKIFMGNSDFLGNFPRGSTYHPCFLNFYQFYHLNTVTKRYLMPIPPAFQVSLLSLIYQKTG